MQVGQERFGMQTMNQSLASLHLRRLISLDDAIGRSSDPDELRNLIGRGPAAAGGPAARSAGKA
jgi:twitching motility protein PilT